MTSSSINMSSLRLRALEVIARASELKRRDITMKVYRRFGTYVSMYQATSLLHR